MTVLIRNISLNTHKCKNMQVQYISCQVYMICMTKAKTAIKYQKVKVSVPFFHAWVHLGVWTDRRLILAEHLTLMINSPVTEQDQTHSSSVAVGWPSPREWVEISVREVSCPWNFVMWPCRLILLANQTKLPVFNQPQVMATALTAIVFSLFKNILHWNGWYLYVPRY